MSAVIKQDDGHALVEKVVIGGDLAALSAPERMDYYKRVCESVGLNPLTRPFEYLRLNGKLVLYARKDATEQLRTIHGISIYKVEREQLDDIFTVTAYARDRNGREDSDIGAVNVAGLKGEAKANAMMKAITKAKRRVTLSVSGLGMLDETEIETIPDAVPLPEVAPITEQQAADLAALLEETGSDVAAFLKYLSKQGKVAISAIAEIPSNMYHDAVAALERKRAKQ